MCGQFLVEWLKPGPQALEVVAERGDIRGQLVLGARQRLYRVEQCLEIPAALGQAADPFRERVQVIESAHDQAGRDGEGIEHGRRV
jgi:hypothetical protein